MLMDSNHCDVTNRVTAGPLQPLGQASKTSQIGLFSLLSDIDIQTADD